MYFCKLESALKLLSFVLDTDVDFSEADALRRSFLNTGVNQVGRLGGKDKSLKLLKLFKARAEAG